MTAAVLLGNLTEALETAALVRGEVQAATEEARYFRLDVRVDMCLANLCPGAALAVAITDSTPDW